MGERGVTAAPDGADGGRDGRTDGQTDTGGRGGRGAGGQEEGERGCRGRQARPPARPRESEQRLGPSRREAGVGSVLELAQPGL